MDYQCKIVLKPKRTINTKRLLLGNQALQFLYQFLGTLIAVIKGLSSFVIRKPLHPQIILLRRHRLKVQGIPVIHPCRELKHAELEGIKRPDLISPCSIFP